MKMVYHNVLIKCNSELQLICAVTAAICKYKLDSINFYILAGQINGFQISLEYLKDEKFIIINNYVELMNIAKKHDRFTVISASHFPYSLIKEITYSKVHELIRIEEGIGSYGNLYTKVINLFRHSYGKLAVRHSLGIMVAKFLEFVGIQERIFAYDDNGRVNVVFARNFRRVVAIFAKKTRSFHCRNCLLLPTERLESYLADREFTNFSRKYHPAWNSNEQLSDFDTTGIERIVGTTAGIKFLISEFSSSMLYLHLYSDCIGICMDKNNGKFLTMKQKCLFHRHSVVIPF
jgi:hypothetical protein